MMGSLLVPHRFILGLSFVLLGCAGLYTCRHVAPAPMDLDVVATLGLLASAPLLSYGGGILEGIMEDQC
jgi:hypothetical protein